jgi:hypothetical protein
LNYSNVISEVYREFPHSFGALASPTLSKQETVTSLHATIQSGIKNGSLAPSIPWRSILEFGPRLLLMFMRVAYASMRFRIRQLPEEAVVFRTWLVPRSFKGEGLVDDYFRQLPDDLAVHENIVTSFSSTDFGLLKRAGRAQRSSSQIISYGLLSIFDVIALFWDYITTAWVKARQRYVLDSTDITAFINHSLLLDYLLLRSFEAYAEKYKCRRLVQYKIKAFVYVFENQSLEKACCATLRGHDIQIIGYQSSGFSPIFLNFFPTEVDSRQHPMPDTLLTVGDDFRKYLLEHGHFSIPVETYAALRFSYPVSGGRYIVLNPNPEILRRILYAFPVHITQYTDTLNDLISVFQNSGILVELKLHPLYQLSDMKGTSVLPDNFSIVTDVRMETLRERYDCVLFNDNSFGIEALMKGVKSYQFSRDGSFTDDRFMYFNLWKVDYQLDDLHHLKSAILSKSYNKAFDVKAVADYVNRMYHPYSPESADRFCQILNPGSLVGECCS